MFQRDYLLRMIEQMTESIGKVLGLRQQKKIQQAYEALDDLLHRLSLPKRDVLKTLAVPDIVSLLSGPGGVTDTDKLYGVSKVLFEDGEVAADEGDRQTANASKAKAIRLFAEAVRHARVQGAALLDSSELEAMLSRIDRGELSAEACVSLAGAYEAYGRFDAAEDRWFDAMERGAEDAYEQGVRFYERLLATDERRLAAGGLPRDEVEEGFEEFKRRFGPHASG